ncbi:hypothetical protein [Kordia sp.]|uniref:hypothetical protein n=1 Tax=Kordia sp. TaxID=1965332 RepID=UPI003D2A5DAA
MKNKSYLLLISSIFFLCACQSQNGITTSSTNSTSTELQESGFFPMFTYYDNTGLQVANNLTLSFELTHFLGQCHF